MLTIQIVSRLSSRQAAMGRKRPPPSSNISLSDEIHGYGQSTGEGLSSTPIMKSSARTLTPRENAARAAMNRQEQAKESALSKSAIAGSKKIASRPPRPHRQKIIDVEDRESRPLLDGSPAFRANNVASPFGNNRFGHTAASHTHMPPSSSSTTRISDSKSKNIYSDKTELEEWIATAEVGDRKNFKAGKDRRKKLHDLCDALQRKEQGLILTHSSSGTLIEDSRSESSIR